MTKNVTNCKILLFLAPDGVFDHFKRLKLTPGHCQWSHWGPESFTGIFPALLLAEIVNERLKILTSLLFDLQTSVRGQNGVEFDQESAGHGPRHVTHLLDLLLAEVANERLKILTFLFFDQQTSVRGQNWVEFCQESTGHVRFFLALLLAEIANGSEWLRMTPGWVRVRARGEGRGGLFLGRFYFSKWLTLPVLGHKKVLVLTIWIFEFWIVGNKQWYLVFIFIHFLQFLNTIQTIQIVEAE